MIRMEILLACPANLATGGTEGIHNLTHTLSQFNADTKILYVGDKLDAPQPKEYEKYGCKYITELPNGYKGVLIFPEVWGNKVIEPQFKDCLTVINWQGVDVYNWHTPLPYRGVYRRNSKTLHIANSEYAVDFLRRQKLNPIKISDCLNDEFYNVASMGFDRKDVVLYNPTQVKLTRFQEAVMARATTELGIKFRAIEELDRASLIDLMQHSKLYIDFGVFSGRERLPREAVMCGCCILTSRDGTAGYYADNPIPDNYTIATEFTNVDQAVKMIAYVLKNYHYCYRDFNLYRELLQKDRQNYPQEVEKLYY